MYETETCPRIISVDQRFATTTSDHTPPSVPAFPTRRLRSSRVQAAITLLPVTESLPPDPGGVASRISLGTTGGLIEAGERGAARP